MVVNPPPLPTEGTGPSGLRDLSTSARDAVRSRGAPLRGKRFHSQTFYLGPLIDSLSHAAPHPSITVGHLPRARGHSGSLCRGFAAQIRHGLWLMS